MPCTSKIHQSCNRCLSFTTGDKNITGLDIIMGIWGIIVVHVLQSFTKLSVAFYQYIHMGYRIEKELLETRQRRMLDACLISIFYKVLFASCSLYLQWGTCPFIGLSRQCYSDRHSNRPTTGPILQQPVKLQSSTS
jgi:hypothetical protein